MFGLKLKSWMEAHLGRPHRQKSTSNQSGAGTSTSSGSQPPPPPSTCSSSALSAAHHSKRTGASKEISGSCSSSGSTSNSTTNSTSSSHASTSTAIGIGGGGTPASVLLPGAGGGTGITNPTCNFPPTTVISSSSVAAVGSESVAGSQSAQQQQQQEGKIGKFGGGGGSTTFPANKNSLQNGETIGTKESERDSRSQAPDEPDSHSKVHQQKLSPTSTIPVSSSNGGGGSVGGGGNNNRSSSVSTSVSNSTSILSGGSSFCNSLSSPDTGYSTDGYSPKSVYPALSFSAEGQKQHSSASSSSTASKSSYTISSLVSSELLHCSSSGDSKHTSASCSVQDGLDEHHHLLHHHHQTPSPAAMLLTCSHSSSSGISESGSSGGAPAFPKGSNHGHPSSIPENETMESCTVSGKKEKQVIMGVVGESRAGDDKVVVAGKTIQLELEQKLLPSSGTTATSTTTVAAGAAVVKAGDLNHSHSKFSPFSIDFLKRSSSSAAGSGNNVRSEDVTQHHGRTHRRAESMDARTPSHEDYKPLVDGDEDEGDNIIGSAGNPSSHLMTGSSSAAHAKAIRTSFVLDNAGQIVEYSSYKNAYSICSPRRERTRIKTNPWITLSNNKKDGNGGGSKSDSANKSAAKNANLGSSVANSSSSGSDGETEKAAGKMKDGGGGGGVCVSGGGGEQTSDKDATKVFSLETGKPEEDEGCDKSRSGSKRVNLVEINKKEEEQQEEADNFMEDETGIVDHDSDDRSSSAHILYRISSASDSGKGSLVDPETNRNSTESSCLLSEDSTRNSIISQEASGSSCCGRSSSGESISQHQHHHHNHHHPLENDDALGHASASPSSRGATTGAKALETNSSDQKEQQQGHSHQSKNGDQGQRTFRNASVATTDLLLVKSASVSVGVGTTGSNKSANKQHPVMVDKETDILSDWATNTDVEDTEDDLETDRDDEDEAGNNEDNETVTPAPSSPGTDVDRALFSQSSSATTDIDFGDSSAATQASSTQVFPPSSLLRQHHHHHNNGSSNNSGTYTNSNVIRFHNGSGSNNNSQSESCVGESYERHYMAQQQQQQQHNNINLNPANTSVGYPSVVPIVRPVLAAAHQQQQHPETDTFAFDLVNHHHHHHSHTLQPQQHPFQPSMFYPSYPLEDDLLEDDYPQVKPSSKGLARGALGFLRKIFKKGACSSQRHSPDSLASSAAGKKKGRGKSDNNLSGLGMGSPLLTISEPLSNPRYSAAVLTTKKQMNPALNGCYFLTPTPNSFRRRSGGGTGVGGIFGVGQSSDPNNSGSDSGKGSSSSKQHSQQSKSVKTDIIRLPQGPLSPPQSIIPPHHQRATNSSHSSGSSSSCSALSISNNPGIPQQCSTFLPHAAPVFFPVGSAGTNNANLIATISQHQQSNSAGNTNASSSTNSSIHSLMSTSTCSGNNRPPSQQQQHHQPPKTPIPIAQQNLYANSSSASQNPITTNSRHSNNPFVVSNNGSNNNNNTARSPPPGQIPENSPFLNGKGKSQTCRRDLVPPSSSSQHQQSLKGMMIPPYESSPRLPAANATARMSSPSFNNSYSPIHRLVVTGGSHLRNGNPPSNNLPAAAGLGHFPAGVVVGESPLPIPRYNGGDANSNGNSNNFAAHAINRSHASTSMSQSPLINHRSSPHPQQQYPPQMASSSQQQGQQPSHNFFASPSPILRNPRYQYITSSNQNSPILNATKRLNGSASTTIILPCSSSNNGGSGGGGAAGPNGPPPLLTTFTPLPSSSSSASQRESLINNNNGNTNNANTITIGGGGGGSVVNLNPSAARQVVSSSLSYNEFENLSRQEANFSFHNQKNGNNGTSFGTFIPPPPTTSSSSHLQQQPPQQLLHQNYHKSNKTPHHLPQQQNHYYSSPIVKQRAAEQQQQQQLEQTFWNNNGGGGGGDGGRGGMRQYQNLQQQQQQPRSVNQNLRFNSFLVRHRQLPQFYHTQWGLQERIYETVDSEDERSSPGRGSDEMDEQSLMAMYTQQQLRGGGDMMMPRMRHSFSHREGGFLRESNHVNGEDEFGAEGDRPTKRSKPKTLSASGRPFPRPVVALPMMPAGTFLSETETRLLESDKESDRKYKRLINEAEALLKEISVEKEKRAVAAAVAGGGVVLPRDNNAFRLEDCPQSDPLRRKAYDCWALRRLQQELAGCCASPPVLHRSRLNLQSPSTPTLANNPYLSHFQNMSTAAAAPLPHPSMMPQPVPYLSTGVNIDPNQNSFEF